MRIYVLKSKDMWDKCENIWKHLQEHAITCDMGQHMSCIVWAAWIENKSTSLSTYMSSFWSRYIERDALQWIPEWQIDIWVESKAKAGPGRGNHLADLHNVTSSSFINHHLYYMFIYISYYTLCKRTRQGRPLRCSQSHFIIIGCHSFDGPYLFSPCRLIIIVNNTLVGTSRFDQWERRDKLKCRTNLLSYSLQGLPEQKVSTER